MNYTFLVTYNSITTEVFPLNWLECSLVDKQEKDQIFYRRKFEGALTFGGKKLCADFNLFYDIETTDPCGRIDLTIYLESDIYWEGYFSTSMGSWDLDCQTFTITPLAIDNYSDWEVLGDIEYNIISGVATTVTTNTTDQAYTRNRWLTDVIEYLAQQIYPAVTLTSWFLSSEDSIVIGGVNQYRYLTIAQKSDIKRPNSANPATIAMLSFNELMHILKMYNLYWKYDGVTLRIEHYDYWTNTEGLNLRNREMTSHTNKYSYTKEDMYQFEKFNNMEAGDSNYTEHWITYEGPCVKETWEYTSRVTTDLSYIVECMADAEGLGLESNIDDDGFVILANELQGGNYYVCYGVAYQNTIGSYNYVNSWSYLLRAFFLHGRVLMQGKIQQTDVDFISVRKTKKQNVSAVICSAEEYDPENYITTELGETWFGGQKGYIDKASIKPYGQIDFELLYGEDSNEDVEMPERSKTLHVCIDIGWTTVTSHLSEPNIYDTYYWIWFDDDPDPLACMEIMIPAGDTYQEDPITFVGPPSSARFNISDPSLDGWNFKYCENETWNECFDVDCGGMVPPAIPDPPIAIGASQSGFCEPVDVSWNASGGATYYKVYRKPNLSMEDIYEFIANENGTHYYDYDAGVRGGFTFYYKIKACNISGCSGDSNEVNCSVLC